MNNNRKIALNTGVIYVKLLVSVVIGLYTSRVVLQALGADDYGLYSVVGGIVSFLNVIGTTMITVSYRFISVELGKGDKKGINKVFNTVLLIHFLLALSLLLLGGAIGLFYVNNYLNVAAEKLSDARFVLYISLTTTALSLITVPFRGLIQAHEKFVFSSTVEVVELLIKLICVIGLAEYAGNRLRLFTLIIALTTIVAFVSFFLFCFSRYREYIRFKFNKRIDDYKNVFSFAWWSLLGAIAFVGKEQGAAMIINSFFGTALNAAFGLASQINRYAMMFTKGLSQSATPQIMKSYGANDSDRVLFLVYTISRVSTLLMLFIVIPLFLCMDDILKLWLKTPPEYTAIFAKFMLINTLITMLGAGFDACIQSTGDIKINEIYTGIIYLSILPTIYILYKLGCPPYMNVLVMPVHSLAVRVMQMFILKRLTAFDFRLFIMNSLLPSILTGVVAFVPLMILKRVFGHSILSVLLFVMISVLWILLCVCVIGISKKERSMMMSRIHKSNRA